MSQIFEKDIWIKQSFAAVKLGDKRLNKRLESVVSKIVEKPCSNIPEQMSNWNDVIGCYRFLNNSKVTHKKVQKAHLSKTRQDAKNCKNKTVLFIQDGSEIETQRTTRGAGPIGNHTSFGILMHNCLAVEYDQKNPRVIGLANQVIWEREVGVTKKNETRTQRNNREGKESEYWLKTLKSVGKPPIGTQWVSVGDRGCDIYEFFSDITPLGWDALVRVSQDRSIKIDDETSLLMKRVSELPIGGSKVISIRRRQDTKPKDIELQISWSKVTVNPPKRFLGKKEPVEMWVIRCFNLEEDIEWILYSTLPVTCLKEAIEKIEWYAKRWIIEEYHKCLKTGCQIESNQFESIEPVEVMLGILSVVATILIQMKHIARLEDDRLAKEEVPIEMVVIISTRNKLDVNTLIMSEFWRRVAMLGGFIGRKSDGYPGWQTLWRGWIRLLDMVIGAEAFKIYLEAEK